MAQEINPAPIVDTAIANLLASGNVVLTANLGQALNPPRLDANGRLEAILTVRSGTASELDAITLAQDELAIEKDAGGVPTGIRFGDGTQGGVSLSVTAYDAVGEDTYELHVDSGLFSIRTTGQNPTTAIFQGGLIQTVLLISANVLIRGTDLTRLITQGLYSQHIAPTAPFTLHGVAVDTYASLQNYSSRAAHELIHTSFTSNNVTLKHLSTSALAENEKIACPGGVDIVMAPGSMVQLRRSTLSAHWLAFQVA